jgi:hypothetical protein
VKTVSALDYINRNYSSRDRILLVNAPVIDSRYQWIRWNQPSDLLKLGSFLKDKVGCDVKLYDFMLPVNNKVPRSPNKPSSGISANDHLFSLWRYGSSDAHFSDWLEMMTPKWRPTAIWVSTLTSYWWKGVSATVARLKNRFSDVPVVAYGRYPMLETSHAEEFSFADVLVIEGVDLKDEPADFDLYEKQKPSFCALDIRSRWWPEEVAEKFHAGIRDFVFFNDPLIRDWDEFQQSMKSFLELKLKTKTNLRPKFYALCGLHPRDFNPRVAKIMKKVGFVELHFEYETQGRELNLDAYKEIIDSFRQVEYELPPDQVSAFVHIGLPDDDLERTIRHTLNLFEIFGTVILKPWSPTPGSDLYNSFKDRINAEQIELLSPHLFPFSAVSGITPGEYEDLYLLVAALNQKIRSQAYDCFPGTLAYEMIRSSLNREVWSLPS